MRTHVVPVATLALWGLLGGACGRTDLESGPWYDHDARPSSPDVPEIPDIPEEDVAPDVEPDVEDVPEEVVEDAPIEADASEFTGMSCMSAAMCAICCGGDTACQMGCIGGVDPAGRAALMSVFSCAMSTGCGADFACIMDRCADQFAACDGGPGGTGGCLELAWCLVSGGCTSAGDCESQGLCYQGCFGAARPEVMGVARDLLTCVAGTCMSQCATGLTSTDCILCLGTNCLMALRGCIGF